MSPEQSKPPDGEAPPQRYGTPTALSAILAARSPSVGFGRFFAWRADFASTTRGSGSETALGSAAQPRAAAAKAQASKRL